MGKKKIRKAYTSKGQHTSVARSTVKLVSQGRSELEKALNKIAAWRTGKNPWVTVPGPGTNTRFVRVRANKEWGDPKRLSSTFGRED